MEERGFHPSPNRIEVFRDIAEALNQANDLSAAIEAILPRLGDALGLETGWAFRFDEHKRSFVEVGASGLPPALDTCQQAPLRTGWCECQDQFVRGELGEAVNIVRCSRLKAAQGDTGNLHFHASVPLRSKGMPLGILNLAAPGRTVFDDDALSFLQTVGQQVAVAVDRARMFQLERDKSTRLQRLAKMPADWNGHLLPEALLQRALEFYVEMFPHSACGALTRDARGHAEIVAVAEATQSADDRAKAYVYPRSDAPETGCESILLSEARSAITTPLPWTQYELRLESRLANAFDEADKELLQTFAWQLAAAYAGTLAHHEAMRHTQLEERRRIAAELHDSVSQRLFSAQLLLRTASVQMCDGQPTPSATIERVGELLVESQQEMRRLIHALRPLDQPISLMASLSERVATLSLQARPRVTLTVLQEPVPEPSAKVRAALLAMVDEALHNALKHAEAETISIRLEQNRIGTLTLAVEDNGKGCDSSAIGSGLGTRSIVERAFAIHGEVNIDCRMGQGTRVTMTVPVQILGE
ncbi:GAF domain-containing sensor histidine kinase [Alicyclobacillus sp. SP_1]|uniref:GAF domain-containing sensor histidine kinase n=1 Tax=Alicyclobacillus sp. SP_1 TaxID=2942475 RepID=UPI0021572391|nr:GAF domain-containing sensor histidine kinase [Alicyclobacillus sp. SP_1]